MISKKVKGIKHVGLFLFWMIGINAFGAVITCVDWKANGDGTYTQQRVCFYETGSHEGKYCIVDGVSMAINEDTGFPCGPAGDPCGLTMNSFWESAEDFEGGSGCPLGAMGAIVPISDASLPFILLLGAYSFSICYRKKYRIA